MELMTKAELARTLRVTTRTIEAWVKHGTLAKPFYIGRRALWTKESVVALLEARFRQAQDSRSNANNGD